MNVEAGLVVLTVLYVLSIVALVIVHERTQTRLDRESHERRKAQIQETYEELRKAYGLDSDK